MGIQYYKTYRIKFKVPNNGYIYEEDAWPAINDYGKIVWTLCKDDVTVLPFDYIIDYKLIEE